MLRITIQRAEDDVVMKLEGCLAGPWVDELEACWRQETTAAGSRVRVDLRSVCHVDAAGRELMTRMGVWVLPTANTLEVIQKVREEIPGIQAQLPAGMKKFRST